MTKLRSSQAGHVLSIALVVAALVVVGLAGWLVAQRHHTKTTASTTTGASTQQTAATSSAASNDNASLNQDVQSIDSAMSKENTDSTAANNGLNDQQQQITVPTN